MANIRRHGVSAVKRVNVSAAPPPPVRVPDVLIAVGGDAPIAAGDDALIAGGHPHPD